jgi:hypothetical protein
MEPVKRASVTSWADLERSAHFVDLVGRTHEGGVARIRARVSQTKCYR